MIRDAEIRRLAAVAGIEPRIVELDYVLGWALWGIASHEALASELVFKGGTCLRKCYFPDYRFSEDLDFTATEGWESDELGKAVSGAFHNAAASSGIDFMAREPRQRIVNDAYGRETVKYTIYWRGPHAFAGSPPGLRVDITRHEDVFFDPLRRNLLHPFSDVEALDTVELRCYALEEVMAEKIRAVLGQRIYAVSRDLYDIYFLREHVADEEIARALPRKFAARGILTDVSGIEPLIDRKAEFEGDWERNLVRLLPPSPIPEFAEIWETTVDYLTRWENQLGQ